MREVNRLDSKEKEKWLWQVQVPKEQQAEISAFLRTPGGTSLLKWLFKAFKVGSPLPKSDWEQGLASAYWVVRGAVSEDVVKEEHDQLD